MSYKRKQPGKFKYILIRISNKFSWRIYLQTKRIVTFKAYFRRYESIFEEDCEKWPDKKKVRLLLSKLGVAEYEKYINFILSRQLV